MSRFSHFSLAALLALGIGTTHADGFDDDSVDSAPSAIEMAADLVIVRPVSLVATVLGTGLFVLQLPLALIQGEKPSDPARKLILEPARYTFTRPLGDLD